MRRRMHLQFSIPLFQAAVGAELCQRVLCRLTIVLVALGCAQSVLASGFRETSRFADIPPQVEKYVSQFGAKNVLVVVDIDNTLLAMDTDLGSDQWFEWQEYLLQQEPNSPQLVAPDFPGLLAVQGLLFATTHMHPPEPEQPQLVAQIQAAGVDTVVLTSRGDEFRAATLRELLRNGYDFSPSAPTTKLLATYDGGPYETCSRFLPYRLKNSEDFGLTTAETEIFNLNAEPRTVSYGEGVMMVAGQHKGAMLLVLMHLIDHDYKAVVFVDDHGRHVHRVYDALARRGVEVTSFHYQKQDAAVQRFRYGSKQGVTQRWKEIDQALQFFASPPAATKPVVESRGE